MVAVDDLDLLGFPRALEGLECDSRLREVVSRDEILDRVWGYDAFPTTRTIDNFIVRLRRAIEPDPQNPRFIHTVRGTGYRLTP